MGLPVRAWLETIENPAVDVLLRTLFIDRCIPEILPTERKSVPWYLKPVEAISTSTLMSADHTVFTVNTPWQDDASSEEVNWGRVVHQVPIPACTKAPVFLSCPYAVFLTIKTYGNVIERRCSMKLRGLLDILSGKPF